MASTRASYVARARTRPTRIRGAGGDTEGGGGDEAEACDDEADATQLVQRRDGHRDLAAEGRAWSVSKHRIGDFGRQA